MKKISDKRVSISGFDKFVGDVYETVDKVNATLRRLDEKNIVMMQSVTSLCPNTEMKVHWCLLQIKLFNVRIVIACAAK